MSTTCQQIQRNDQIRSIMAVVKDNSLEFALQETAKGFSRSGKSEPVAASSTEKMFWWFYQLVFGESAIFQLFVRVKEYMSKKSACLLVICLLRRRTDSKALPEASLGDVGAGKFQFFFLVSLFVCCLRFSWVFCDIPSIRQSIRIAQIADIPCAWITNAFWKIFVTFDGNASLFQNFG